MNHTNVIHKTMKHILFLLAFYSFTFNISAQKGLKVPEKVKRAFAEDYSNVNSAKWEVEGDSFEAEWKEGKLEMSVLYSVDGTLIQTETEMDVATLPSTVSAFFKKESISAKIDEASRIVLSGGVVNYEVEAGGTDYLFDSEGNLIGSESEDDEGDGEDE